MKINKLIYKIYGSIILSILMVTTVSSQIKYPVTKKVNQEDNYFGTTIQDPYRWLENDTADDVKAWVESENKVTFDYLNKIPFRSKIHKRITEIVDYEKYSSPQKVGDYYIYEKNSGLQN